MIRIQLGPVHEDPLALVKVLNFSRKPGHISEIWGKVRIMRQTYFHPHKTSQTTVPTLNYLKYQLTKTAHRLKTLQRSWELVPLFVRREIDGGHFVGQSLHNFVHQFRLAVHVEHDFILGWLLLGLARLDVNHVDAIVLKNLQRPGQPTDLIFQGKHDTVLVLTLFWVVDKSRLGCDGALKNERN